MVVCSLAAPCHFWWGKIGVILDILMAPFCLYLIL